MSIIFQSLWLSQAALPRDCLMDAERLLHQLQAENDCSSAHQDFVKGEKGGKLSLFFCFFCWNTVPSFPKIPHGKGLPRRHFWVPLFATFIPIHALFVGLPDHSSTQDDLLAKSTSWNSATFCFLLFEAGMPAGRDWWN